MSKEDKTKAAKDSKKRREMLKQATPKNLTDDERLLITKMYEYARAKSIETNEPWDVDHIIPLTAGGSHAPENLLIMPKRLNQAKSVAIDTSFEKPKEAVDHLTVQKIIDKEKKGRTKNGKFAPGVSGNMNGRPKKKAEGTIDPTIFERLEELCNNYKGDEQAKQFFRIEIDLLKGSSDYDMVTKRISELRTFFMTKKKDEEKKIENVTYHFVSHEETVDKILAALEEQDDD